jgi:AraC-like DNA-binding protein
VGNLNNDAFSDVLMASISSSSRLNIDKLIENLGGSVEPICSELGISMDDVTGPPHPIPAGDVIRLLNYCAKTLNADDFGLRLSTLQSMAVLGPVWPLIQNAQTVRDLLNDLEKYFVLFTQAMYARCETLGKDMRVSFGVSGSHRSRDKHVVEHGLGLVCREIRSLSTVPDWHPKMVQLRFSEPCDLTLYHQVFGPNIHFNQDINAIFFDDYFLSSRIVHANASHRKLIQPLIEEYRIKQSVSFTRQVEMLIRDTIPTEPCTLSNIALKMSMSERTVQRNLDADNVTFSSLLDRVRKDIALNYLRQSDLSVLQISEILGYKNLSTFSRSFKRATGKSPSQVRTSR